MTTPIFPTTFVDEDGNTTALPNPAVVMRQTEYRVRKSPPMGDAYIVRARLGINNKPRTFTITYTNIPTEAKDVIEAFLDANEGVVAFMFPLNQAMANDSLNPGTGFSVSNVRVVCENAPSWSKYQGNIKLWSGHFVLTEDFGA